MRINLAGKRFGKWTVIYDAGTSESSRDRLWHCKCDCGQENNVKTYYLTQGYSTQCKRCGIHKIDNYKNDQLPLSIWNRIVRGAKHRGIKINITREDAYQLYVKQNKKCKLTGLDIPLPKHDQNYRLSGCIASLDRIDSSNGYCKNNLQWVHRDVNRMKNVFTQQRFIEICKLITNNLK